MTDLFEAGREALCARSLEAHEHAMRANAIICLIHRANFLLDRQIAGLEAVFVSGPGYSEQWATGKIRHRSKEDSPLDEKPPPCPKCVGIMALRTAKAGKHPGNPFWGCKCYSGCKGIMRVQAFLILYGGFACEIVLLSQKGSLLS